MAIIDINNIVDGVYTDPDTGLSTSVTQTGGDDNIINVFGLTDAIGIGSSNAGFDNDVIETYQYDFSNPVETIIVEFAADNPGETFQVNINGNPYAISLSQISPNSGLTINGSGQIVSNDATPDAGIHTLTINVPTGISSFSMGNTVATGMGVAADIFFDGIIACFVSGTLIRTQRGEVPIETLSAGDMVLTVDNGYQPIRWVGSSKRPATGDLAPILIRKGALDNTRDLRVSPQHRMLLQGWQAELLYGEIEVLATAKSLVNDHSIIRVEGGEVEYFHMLFDRHEIVYAEGIPSESFHPGEQGWKSLDQATRDEILTLFPQLDEDNFEAYGPSVRTSLKHKEGQLLGEYMTKSTKDVLNNA